jgi:hypothetical protein
MSSESNKNSGGCGLPALRRNIHDDWNFCGEQICDDVPRRLQQSAGCIQFNDETCGAPIFRTFQFIMDVACNGWINPATDFCHDNEGGTGVYSRRI